MRSIEAALSEGTAALRDAGLEKPRLEAEVLMSAVLQCGRAMLYAYGGDLLSEDRERVFAEGLKRRCGREPMAYIIGKKEFMGLTFTVTPDVLIPRPDTEIVVETALAVLKGHPGMETVLDLCTGSGAIGLSVKNYRPDLRLTLTDIAPEALKIAEINAKSLGIEAEMLPGDLFNPVGNRRFDCIVSNPPYIPTAVIATLESDVKDYEPETALDGGMSGFDFYDRIIGEAEKHLNDGGALLLEAGDGQADGLLEKLSAAGFDACIAEKDLIGMTRCVGGYKNTRE